MDAFEYIRSRLDKCRPMGEGQFVGCCPAHDDSTPSLSVALRDGKVLLNCFNGCKADDIAAALGLKMGDLFDGNGNGFDPPVQPRKRPSEVGPERVVARYEYEDEEGRPLFRVLRIEHDEDRQRKKRFSQERWEGNSWTPGLGDTRRVLWRLPLVIEAVRLGLPLFVVEGEKCVEALEGLGKVATTSPGGASNWRPEYAQSLRGATGPIYILPDNDQPGEKYATAVKASLRAVGVRSRFVRLPGLGSGGDVADWIEAGGTAEALDGIVASSLGEPVEGVVALAATMRDVTRVLDDYEQGRTTAVRTGLPALDRSLGGGWQRGDVYLLGGATGRGKTTLVMSFARVAAESGKAVLVVSPEMKPEQLAEREVIRRSRTTRRDRSRSPIDMGEPDEFIAERQERARGAHLRVVGEILGEAPPIYFSTSPEIVMAQVEEMADALDDRLGLSLVVIDYAQQLAAMDPRTPRYLTVGEVATRSIGLARRYDVPVVIASQVNVTKTNKGVEVSDADAYEFRESAVMEHKAAASMILVVNFESGAAWLKSRKNRNGPRFEIELAYEPAFYTVNAKADE